ncbi:type I restriction endonuclease subunit R [Pseudodesulfovibrio sediminis]|uniref:Type I restriction enzyme endonuclease subunit n=1 Tax=Pseudodesulfovibrio sediminis TaxID=2810563 RepID=A0ABM7P8U9_9BACT|nr:type I restriction endonuclease subunit R [Pseudodesulfovibrio sediminis]BCS89465.1 DEAD/DEAH box helicase [Pseudodesulfovibrio sediminis]
MVTGPEDWFAETPCIEYLQTLDYDWLRPEDNHAARDGLNHVMLRDVFLTAIKRINGLSDSDARAVYGDMLHVQDNERWTQLLRGDYSRNVEGEAKKQTVNLIDFKNPENNTFTVTNQLTVQAQQTRRPDLVVYVNGIPLVVIEAKSPVSYKSKASEAYDQINQYQEQIPRLFYSNIFNIITNGEYLLYGATGSPADYWGAWKDPYPRKRDEFPSDFERGLWSLLEPSRLLDIVAHFIVFEKRDGEVVKKMCRYQQYRAVNKIVDRVVEGEHRKGLVWHTQGSGKSLTMAMAALKLKSHLTIDSPELESPNILVLTDRIDLDDQISATFQACGLPNPTQIKSLNALRRNLHQGTNGLTLLSTIFKFDGSTAPVANSDKWILLVDECHRTQEKDLGAYLRATLPDARFFGFTGTPVKKNDTDTYANFSPEGEAYLDKYGIDDAVADGATIPINYTSRMANMQIDEAKLDIMFDQLLANEPDEVVQEAKAKGVSVASLAKVSSRVELIAFDMWTHFKAYALPDGFKAQVVGIDREAIILYQRALTKVIAEDLIQDGMEQDAAFKEAERYCEPVYSSNQEDGKTSEDKHIDSIRKDLVKYALPRADRTEADVKTDFKVQGQPPYFLLVCSKLLTGFDAPVENVMYLDNPLKEHNLLQAIARTNRLCGAAKQNGLIVDYIGVTQKLNKALESYRSEDVQNAMRNIDVLRQQLKAAHKDVMAVVKDFKKGAKGEGIKEEFRAFIQALATEDAWFTFRRKARIFIKAYEVLSPDPAILDYTDDMKWVAMFLPYATQHFEKKQDVSLRNYSAKIRDILEDQLHATGISTVIKLRTLTDPEYWKDFEPGGKDENEIKEAAIRKATELKKILVQKTAENPLQFGPFSEKVKEVLERMRSMQIDFAEELKNLERLSKELTAEINPDGPLEANAHGIYKILEAFMPEGQASTPSGNGDGESAEDGEGLNHLQELAVQIDELYASDEHAPPGWHTMEQVKKDLRQQVRRIVIDGGLKEHWKSIPPKVEDYALGKYAKLI